MQDSNPRSVLFVSGERVDRFDKAMASDADLVCIDLEDAVHPSRKQAARDQVLGWLNAHPAAGGDRRVGLRINSLQTAEGLRDVIALIEAGARVTWLLLPKVEDAVDIQRVDALAGSRFGSIAALIETPLGIEKALFIARAGGRLGALMLGGADLSAALGARFDWDGLIFARARLVNAARAVGLQVWDVPHLDIGNPAGLAEETRKVIALGFDCKAAIHPIQIQTIHAAHRPTAEELDWAEALMAAVPAHQTNGAFLFRGHMVDEAVLRKARRILDPRRHQ